MTITEIAALCVAVGSLILSIITSRSKVKSDEFSIVRETVDTLYKECQRQKASLQEAQQKIEALEQENETLRAELRAAEGRIEGLEDENRDLKRKLAASDPPDG